MIIREVRCKVWYDEGMTRKFELNAEELEEINYQRYNHLVPLVQRRMDVVRMQAFGLQHQMIAKIIGVGENTVGEYCDYMSKAGLKS